MSGTTAAVEGYEQQYRITAWLALLLWEDLESLLVERPGEEDATLVLRAEAFGDLHVVEMQAKDHQGAVGLSQLAEWLLHFVERRADEALLDRLEADPTRRAVFAVKGRVSDALRPLLLSPDKVQSVLTLDGATSLKRDALRELLKLFGTVSVGDESTGLGRLRRDRADLWSRKKHRDLRGLLKRVFIVEQLSHDEVITRGQRLLATRHRVPWSQARKAFDPLLRKRVEEARSDQVDLLPLMKAELAQHQLDRVFIEAPVYRSRALLTPLHQVLQDEHVLLLTGPPMSGKTHIAEQLGQRMQDQGVHVRVTSNVDDGERFLAQGPGGEERLLVLNDPFGSLRLKSDSHDLHARVANLVDRARAGRSLICTCRGDLLSELLGSPVSTAGHDWRDVRVDKASEAVEIWEAWGGSEALAEEAVERVSRLLRGQSADELLQPGHLRHLAKNWASLNPLDDKVLLRRAHVEAKALGDDLSQHADMRQLVAMLALTATCRRGPSEPELCDYLTEGPPTPTRTDSNRASDVSTIGGEVDEFRPPVHARGGVVLPEPWSTLLDKLEERGLVEWRDEWVRFAHPLYEAAACVALGRHIGAARRPSSRDVLYALFNGVVFGMNPRNASQCLRRLTEDPTLPLSELADYLLEVERQTLFAAVVDEVVAGLTRLEEGLSVEHKENLRGLIAASPYRHQRIHWTEDGIAFLDTRNRHSLFAGILSDFDAAPLEEARRRQTGGEPLRSRDLWELARRTTELGAQERDALTQAMDCGEALIRGEAAERVFKLIDDPDSPLVYAVLGDRHPQVLARAMQGLALGWTGREPGVTWILYHRLSVRMTGESWLELPAKMLADFRHIDGWSPDWYHGKTTAWDLWARLAADVLPRCPPSVRLDVHRLYDCARDAIEAVDLEVGVAAVEAWVEWGRRRVNTGYMPDADVLAGADLLMRADGATADHRASTLKTLLDVPWTDHRIHTARDLLRGWDKLDKLERLQLIEFVSRPSPDHRWLRGAVLAMEEVPEPVQEALLPEGVRLSDDPGALLADLPEEILEDVLNAVTGWTHPMGTQSDRHERWGAVLDALLLRHEHPLFELALGYRLEWLEPDDTLPELLRRAFQTASPARRAYIVEQLLHATAIDPEFKKVKYWQLILEESTDEERVRWAEAWVPWVNVLSHFGRMTDLLLHIPTPGGRPFLELVLEHLPGDQALYFMQGEPPVCDDEALLQWLMDVMKILSEVPPELISIHDLLLQALAHAHPHAGRLGEGLLHFIYESMTLLKSTVEHDREVLRAQEPAINWTGWVRAPRD